MSWYATQAGLKLTILLHRCPKYWDYTMLILEALSSVPKHLKIKAYGSSSVDVLGEAPVSANWPNSAFFLPSSWFPFTQVPGKWVKLGVFVLFPMTESRGFSFLVEETPYRIVDPSEAKTPKLFHFLRFIMGVPLPGFNSRFTICHLSPGMNFSLQNVYRVIFSWAGWGELNRFLKMMTPRCREGTGR